MPDHQAQNEYVMQVGLLGVEAWEDGRVDPECQVWWYACHVDEERDGEHVPELELYVTAWTQAAAGEQTNIQNFYRFT